MTPWFPFRDGNDVFDIIEKDAHILALTEAVLEAAWQKLCFMTMFSKQGTKGQAWH